MNRPSKQIKLGHMTYLNSAVFYSNLSESKYSFHPYTPREMAKSIEENKIFADSLDYFNLKKLIKIYGNVKGESFNGNFTADILNLNINILIVMV